MNEANYKKRNNFLFMDHKNKNSNHISYNYNNLLN